MAFGWAGAGAGASDALEQILVRQRADFLRQQENDRQNKELAARERDYADAAAERKLAREYRDRQEKLAIAKLESEQQQELGPGAEWSPEGVARVKGTVYGGRVRETNTVPGTMITGNVTAPAPIGQQSQPFANDPAMIAPSSSSVKETAIPSDPHVFQATTRAQDKAATAESTRRKTIEAYRMGTPEEQAIAKAVDAGLDPPASLFKPREDFTLNEGDIRFNPEGEVIARGNRKTGTPGSIELQLADAYERGDVARIAVLEKAMNARDPSLATEWVLRNGKAKEIKRGTARDGDIPFHQQELTGNAQATVINQLSKQWATATKPLVELDRQAKLMRVGMENARKGNRAAGSQAVLVTFQKILDPESVVRESEYMRSAAGLAMLARVQGAFEQLQYGGANMPLAELEKFRALAEEAVKAASTGYIEEVKKRLGRTADYYKIPQDLIFEDYRFGATPEEQQGGGDTINVDGFTVQKKK